MHHNLWLSMNSSAFLGYLSLDSIRFYNCVFFPLPAGLVAFLRRVGQCLATPLLLTSHSDHRGCGRVTRWSIVATARSCFFSGIKRLSPIFHGGGALTRCVSHGGVPKEIDLGITSPKGCLKQVNSGEKCPHETWTDCRARGKAMKPDSQMNPNCSLFRMWLDFSKDRRNQEVFETFWKSIESNVSISHLITLHCCWLSCFTKHIVWARCCLLFFPIMLILLSSPFIAENPDYRSYQVKLDLLQLYVSPKTHGLWKQQQKQQYHPDKNMFFVHFGLHDGKIGWFHTQRCALKSTFLIMLVVQRSNVTDDSEGDSRFDAKSILPGFDASCRRKTWVFFGIR